MAKNNTRSKVAKVLNEVRLKYNIGNRRFTQKDFYRICAGEDIDLIDKSVVSEKPQFKNVQGFYATDREIRVIYLRSFWLRKFDLFVAYHELGHHFMKHHDRKDYNLAFGDHETYRMRPAEQEANEFASMALSPGREVDNA